MVSVRSGALNANQLYNEFVLVQHATFKLFKFRYGLLYVPAGQERFQVRLHGKCPVPEQMVLTFVRLPRLVASLLLPLQNYSAFRGALSDAQGPLSARLRMALLKTADSGPSFPGAYAAWVSWFDNWEPARIATRLEALLKTDVPSIAVMVLHAGTPGPALEQTLRSVRTQVLAACQVILVGPERTVRIETGAAAYVAVLQAGEVMPAHTLLVLAEALRQPEPPAILYADEDQLAVDGVRTQPLFKPEISLTMMCSGLLVSGVWLIRSDILEALSPITNGWAECLRLRAWFLMYRMSRGTNVHRVPALLTHRSEGTESAPPAALAELVQAFLVEAGYSVHVMPGMPLRVDWRPGALAHAKISILVPSRLQGQTQLDCISAVLKETRYQNFEILVIVAQNSPLSAAQKLFADQLLKFYNVRVELMTQSSFNYSAVNNEGASRTDGDFICLLNDDVSPLGSDWLERLLGFFQDPACGVVGPRLLYPNGLTQHAGVLLGLGGLVDHAHRFLPREAQGYGGRAGVDQEYSAVTGACLLVRREVFNLISGLNEAYPTAFNDIDFCLRVRQRGYGVVYAGSIQMIHHETLTFGQHYESDAHASPDVERFRMDWSETFLNDPFYNPNLSLRPRSDWQLAFPPRTEAT